MADQVGGTVTLVGGKTLRRRVGIGLATVMGLAGMLVGGVVLGVWLAVDGFRDTHGERSPAAAIVFELGIGIDDGGRISIETPACRQADFLIVRVSEQGGPTVWEARADRPTPIDELLIGLAPVGFDDEVPLARFLEPTTTYEVELFVGYADFPDSPSLIGGAHGSFEPQDLRPDRTLVGRHLVRSGDYQTTACPESGST